MFPILVAIIVIIVDQFTKLTMASLLSQRPDGTIPLISGVLHFTYAENKGAAFSILQNQRLLFIVLTVIVCIAIVYIVFSRPQLPFLIRLSMGMILGGALGNLIDRIRLGYVIDFIDFRLIHYPIFNIADSSVVIGTLFLGYYLIFVHDTEHSKA